MIDIHSHIIPEVDDGSRSLEESIDMIKIANKKGIKIIVTTPHYMTNNYEFKREELESKVHYINEVLKANNIDTEILLGQEIMMDINVFDLLDKGIIGGINNSRYILIEFNMDIELTNFDGIIKKFKDRGYIPVIAHPERYRYVINNIDIVKKWVKSGALMQMNLGSVSGIHGKLAQKTVIKLLNENLIHLCGSDSHFFRNVYKDLDKDLKILKKVVKNNKMYEDIIINNNLKVISNKDIKILKYKKRSIFDLV